jgi:hypothetical protein
MYITICANNEKTKETSYKHLNLCCVYLISTKNPEIWFVLSQKGNSSYSRYSRSEKKIKHSSKLQVTSKYLCIKVIPSLKIYVPHHRYSPLFTSTSSRMITNFIKVGGCFSDYNYFQLKGISYGHRG